LTYQFSVFATKQWNTAKLPSEGLFSWPPRGLDHHFIKIWKREFEDIQETYQQWLTVSAAMDTFILSF